MNTIIISIVVISSVSNMLADLFLSSGRDYANKNQTVLDRVRRTPEKNLFISAVLGMISILCWQFPLYYLAKLPGIAGIIAKISFAITISTIAVFHVVCSLGLALYKADENKGKTVKKYFSVFGSACLVPGMVYTGVMTYMGVNGILNLQWFHYLTLPLPSTLIIQFGLGNVVLRRIPYLESVSGTLSMMIALLGTVHLMISNGF